MSTAPQYRPLQVGEIRTADTQFKRKRAKLWRPVHKATIGRPVTPRLVRAFEFRDPIR